MFSLKHRINRTDFAVVLCVAVLARVMLIVYSAHLAPGVAMAIYLFGVVCVLIAAGKRSRDMGLNGD